MLDLIIDNILHFDDSLFELDLDSLLQKCKKAKGYTPVI